MQILVIDVGTSSMRGVLYDPTGKPLFAHQVPYHVTAAGSRVEQDPADWTQALEEICTIAANQATSVDALALTSQRSSVIPVDGKGRPLRQAIMWQDTRNTNVVQELSPYADRIGALTGARVNTVFSGTKMTWFRRTEPALYAKTWKLCTIADYLTARMTGSYITDETYGSRSLLMGLYSRKWERELLDYFQVDSEKLCDLISPGSISGRVTQEFSSHTGLPAGIPLVSAGGDQQCGALGQGIFTPGRTSITLGTSACLLKSVSQVPEERAGLLCGAASVPGSFVLEGSVVTCGAAMDWLRRELYGPTGFDVLNQEVLASPPGANGVVALPNFQGSGTPNWDSRQRGNFLHLNLGTTRGDMARALLEAIVFEIVNNLEQMDRCGGAAPELRVGGGMVKNPALCRILADASGKPILCGGSQTEDTAFGAWISAAVTLGIYGSFADAYAQNVCQLSVVEPNLNLFPLYQAGRERMNEVGMALYRQEK